LSALTHALRRPGLGRRLRAPLGVAAEAACRLGYVARGLVYISMGVVGLLVAAHRAPHAQGAGGALEALADWPAGLVLLWLTGLGLYGFAGWRVLQSVFDADRQGTSRKALISRAGQAISGVVHAGLAISAFGLLDAAEDLGERDDRAATQAAVADGLALPGGEMLVMLVGLFVLGVGAANLIQAARGGCDKHLTCVGAAAAAARVLGRIGHAGRGAAFVPAGLSLVAAGWTARAGEANGVGGSLDALRSQPAGELVLGLVALGLMAFGVFTLFEARYRRIRASEAIDDAMG
jgi:hypothetical protein